MTRPYCLIAILLALLGRPSQAQAQSRSNLASIALTAYVAPGVHMAAPVTGHPAATGTTVDPIRMSVNTGFRIQLHGAGTEGVVLVRQSHAGLVPWDEVRAMLGNATGPCVLDLVVTPQL
jgi:hypothetical protein